MMFSAVQVLGTVERPFSALSYCPISIGHAINSLRSCQAMAIKLIKIL